MSSFELVNHQVLLLLNSSNICLEASRHKEILLFNIYKPVKKKLQNQCKKHKSII